MREKNKRKQETITKSNLFKVAEIEELKPGKRKVVSVNGTEIVIFNLDGEFYAINNKCPHADFSLGYGLVYGEEIICPGHAWTFNLTTGECITKKSQPVKTYNVVIEGKDIKIKL
jgi:nitrite reductase/ring-hydroxylating ferredoxin subunit